MDVVVSNIQAIGGALEIESKPGEGSTMTLKIPLTLAIIDGIVMEVGDSKFVIETGIVKEFVGLRGNRIVKQPNGKEFVMIRGEGFPVIRLAGDADGMLVVVEVEKQTICILVDSLRGKQEIVVKPIPSYIKKVKGLSGCTQLGDGSIALILDAPGMIDS